MSSPVCTIFFLLAFICSFINAQNVIYMSPGYGNSTDCGTNDNPCLGLANSIKMAKNTSVDTILANPGTYAPQSMIVIDFNLTIR